MSNRYETVDDLPLRKSPLEPVPEPSRVKLVALIVGIVVAAGVGIAAAFGLNLCPYVSAVGMNSDAAPASAVRTPFFLTRCYDVGSPTAGARLRQEYGTDAHPRSAQTDRARR
jgi:hypothetical protein